MATRRAQPQQQQRQPQRRPPQQSQMMTTTSAVDALLAEDEVSLVRPEVDALEAITRSEVAMQLDAAHQWPRNINRFLEETEALATFTKETAASCIYTLPKRKGGDKPITGPSVRLAEMCATSWGNLHTGTRILDVGAREVTAMGIAWDLEKNLRQAIEVKRGIVTAEGRRYGDDMIRVTSMAAMSIARRNVIFTIIPRALVNHLYDKACSVATGVADDTFAVERDKLFGWFVKNRGVPVERVFARLGVTGIAEVTPEHLTVLIGIGTAIKSKDSTIDEAFPPPLASVPAASRGKGAALDAIVEATKAAATPAESAAPADDLPLPVDTVLAELAKADPETWQPGEACRDVIANEWTPEQAREAFDWARVFNDKSVADSDVPPRPVFTVLSRMSGED
jgi:hypothetical protein